MPAYESEGFDPAAPLARAVVAGAGRTTVDIRMLLDTGADISVIPRAIADELGVAVRRSGILLQAYDGNQTPALVADVSVEVGSYRFHGTFVVAEADYGILGRNILNLLLLTLDGPRLLWSA
jgi:predicted aspartyl protease